MPGTTGQSLLPDTGVLSYNGITWSALYHSKIHGKVAEDAADRTTKFMQWELQVDGMVTLEAGQQNTDQTWIAIRKKLSVPGQVLHYNGQGFGGLNINDPNGIQDVAWGPIPEIITFVPMGGSQSALISWKVVAHVPELSVDITLSSLGSVQNGPVLQFNYESSLSYDEDGYASVSFKGTLEIPLTRGPNNSRALTRTVDSFRQRYEDIEVDLTLYKVTRRSFSSSRDKRTSEWEYAIQELTPAGLPAGATGARGTMSVRSARPNRLKPLVTPRWICSIKCTYSIRADFNRRIAFFAFCSLLWTRMWSSLRGTIPDLGAPVAAGQQTALASINQQLSVNSPPRPQPGNAGAVAFYNQLLQAEQNAGTAALNIIRNPGVNGDQALPMLSDFGIDEGLYDDAKSVTFQASWIITTNFVSLLAATGMWQYGLDVGGNVWAASMQNMMGYRSCLAAQINPAAEVIVDMGGGSPLTGSPLLPEDF